MYPMHFISSGPSWIPQHALYVYSISTVFSAFNILRGLSRGYFASFLRAALLSEVLNMPVDVRPDDVVPYM